MKNNKNVFMLEIALIGTAITSCLSDHYALYMVLNGVMGEFNRNLFAKAIPLVCCCIALIIPIVLIYKDEKDEQKDEKEIEKGE